MERCCGSPLRASLWGLGALLLLTITALSLLPVSSPDLGLAHADKWHHLLAYIVLSLYFAQLLPPTRGARAALGTVLLTYGIGIEGLQSLLPHRSAEWADVLADLLGIVIGLMLASTRLGEILRHWERRREAEQGGPSRS